MNISNLTRTIVDPLLEAVRGGITGGVIALVLAKDAIAARGPRAGTKSQHLRTFARWTGADSATADCRTHPKALISRGRRTRHRRCLITAMTMVGFR